MAVTGAGAVCIGCGATTTGGVAGALAARVGVAGAVGRAGCEAGADIAGEAGPIAGVDGIGSAHC